MSKAFIFLFFLIVFFSSQDYLSEILKENGGGGDSYNYAHNLPFFFVYLQRLYWRN